MATRYKGIGGAFACMPKGLRLQMQKGVNVDALRQAQKTQKLAEPQRAKTREILPQRRPAKVES